MAPPTVVGKRVQALHHALIQAGWANKRLPRHDLEAYLAQHLGLGLPNIRNHIDLGRMLGLWSLVDRRPRPTLLLIHPEQTPEMNHRMIGIQPP